MIFIKCANPVCGKGLPLTYYYFYAYSSGGLWYPKQWGSKAKFIKTLAGALTSPSKEQSLAPPMHKSSTRPLIRLAKFQMWAAIQRPGVRLHSHKLFFTLGFVSEAASQDPGAVQCWTLSSSRCFQRNSVTT